MDSIRRNCGKVYGWVVIKTHFFMLLTLKKIYRSHMGVSIVTVCTLTLYPVVVGSRYAYTLYQRFVF